MPRHKPLHYLLLILSLALYLFMAYRLQRHETTWLIRSYSVLFVLYAWICFISKPVDTNFWLYAAVLFRLALIAAIPNLSDDFYRFIWDGRLLANGYHPFAHIPSDYLQDGVSIEGIDPSLFYNLNSPNYFTVYPPLAQFTFWVAAKLFPNSITGSVITLRCFALLAEFGNLWLLKKLLHTFNIPSNRIVLYALNPLIILELTGNLHHESILLFFILLSVWFLHRNRVWSAGISFAAAVCAKLIPLIFLPLLLPRLGWKKAFTFYVVTAFATLTFFAPLLSWEIIEGLNQSIGYYFRQFEFNASILQIVLAFGYRFYGYNILETAGWILGLTGTLFILYYSFKSWRSTQNQIHASVANPALLTAFLFVLFIYLIFSTTVHPWYITTLLAFSVFTPYRFVFIWTYLIFFTYAGYRKEYFTENYRIVALEYIIMFGFLAYELYQRKHDRPKDTPADVNHQHALP